MDQFSNIFFIGTSHISKESIAEIKSTFKTLKPDIVAVELDKKRVHSLFAKKTKGPSFSNIRRVGIKGFLFALFGSWASKKLGKFVGVSPGDEMKTAITLAKEGKVKIALIDQDIEVTLSKFSKALTWKEKWNFVKDLFKGLVLRKKDPALNFDLSKVPSKKIISTLIGSLKQRYPSIYKVLIDERNYVMARKLKSLSSKNPSLKILAVMGAGHLEGIMQILKENEGVTYSYTLS